MASAAYWALRVLRRLPHTARFDHHLDACAAVDIWHLAFPTEHAPLKIAHVVQALPLPNLSARTVNEEPDGLELACIPNEVVRSRIAVSKRYLRLVADNVMDAPTKL